MSHTDVLLDENKSCYSVARSILKVKVTAVKFIKNYLYVGVSGYLSVYDLDSNNRPIIRNFNVLKNNNIYGIVPDKNEDYIAVHGGRYIKLLSTDVNKWSLDEDEKCRRQWEGKDWIWNVQWVRGEEAEEGVKLVVITGHNQLVTLLCDLTCLHDTAHQHQVSVTQSVDCSDKCILYSALVVGDDYKDNLVVMSGTVYQEILIWAPSSHSDPVDGCRDKAVVIHRLKGHNGVIFSINYDVTSQRICSTSDDRTVRVWQVELVSRSSADYNDHLTIHDWQNAEVKPLFAVFGHSARVFKSCMISEKRVISIGEDSYLCVWDENGNNILKQGMHQGGTICCVDYHERLRLAVTGGADGGVNLWPITKRKPTENEDQIGNDLLLTTITPPIQPSRIKLMTDNNIAIVGRNCNGLYFYDNNVSDCEWNRILQDDRIYNYCLVEVSGCRKFIALATINGSVIIIKESMRDKKRVFHVIWDVKLCDSKIFALKWVSQSIFLCCDGDGIIHICRLSPSVCLQEGVELEEEKLGGSDEVEVGVVVSKVLLPPSKERWLTSGVLLNDGSTLVCGDRCGSIHVYHLPDHFHTPIQQLMSPVQTLHKVHGRLGVSCLYINPADGNIWSTGRDGYLRRFSLNQRKLMEQISLEKLPFSWPAHIFRSKQLYGMLVLAFHEMDLLIWSVTNRVVLFKLDCGGGHREWDVTFTNDNQMNFYYLKDKLIRSVSNTFQHLYTPLVEGFHPRIINCLTPLTTTTHGAVVVSGGEDTWIRISLVSNNDWQSIALITGHLSSIRAIAALKIQSNGDKEKFLLLSGGGRAQLKVWSVVVDHSSSDDSTHVPFQVTANECCSHMLRRCGDKVKRSWRETQASVVVDPETRYMDLSLDHYLDHNKDIIVSVYSACSDGYLRVFNYNVQENRLELIRLFQYDRCLLKLTTISFNKNDVLIVSTSTDGKVAFWNRVKENPIYLLKAHQSGINSCDCMVVQRYIHDDDNDNDNLLLLVTGGDDCSVVINLLMVVDDDDDDDGSDKLRPVDCWSSSCLHSSQVTGVKIMGNVIATTSVDQRINLLSWRLDTSTDTDNGRLVKLVVNHVMCHMSSVPDIHGIQTWNHSVKKKNDVMSVCAFGVGAEVVDVRLPLIQPNS